MSLEQDIKEMQHRLGVIETKIDNVQEEVLVIKTRRTIKEDEVDSTNWGEVFFTGIMFLLMLAVLCLLGYIFRG